MRVLMWFKETDLRIHDNTALYQAAQMSTEGMLAIFIVSPEDWCKHNVAPIRVDFILKNLRILRMELEKINIPLLIRVTHSYQEVQEILWEVIEKHHVNALYFNQQYEIDEARRDLDVEKYFNQRGVRVNSYVDQVILAPGDVLTKLGNYYTVFTPFKKAWLDRVKQEKISILSVPKKQKNLFIESDKIPKKIKGYETLISSDFWPAGETQALKKLKKFIENKISHYEKNHDFPAVDGTSCLSPYLTSGILSPRQCFSGVAEIKNADKNHWINELIWREFYKHVLFAFPRVSMNQAFQIKTDKIIWNNDSKLFDAWKQGRTGFPIVDAAMRQLNQTGWMHNRLRMIVAMFLVKDLWIDWRWGETYFMQHLIDGDLAANNGGWQWAASTGTDAVPYFRIFNPVSQSRKFDPKGAFIRRYCPELSSLDDKNIHEPSCLGEIALKKLDYPVPIIDHAKAREKALKAFKKVL